MITGKIRNVMEKFFFIVPDRDGPSMYAEINNVLDGFTPMIGDRVTFRIRKSRRTGLPEAYEVSPVIIDAAPAPAPAVRKVEHPYEPLGNDVLVAKVIYGETPAEYYRRKNNAA